MDLARAGGRLFIGGTLLLAAIDGALVPILLATGIGIWAAKRSHKLSKDTSNLITERTFSDIERWAGAKVDEETGAPLAKEEQDSRRQDAKSLLTQLEKQRKLDERGNATLMRILGVGAYAAPLLGLGYVAGTLVAERNNDDERTRLNTSSG